ncbi:DUF4913 domain-containing protein [Streptomyces triticirhizae]|uniref:DUF4913 domain-containing protein n=1 Tax=Streptomyces triticirhizae TaxID=2483353 RepID=A0A3M2MB47_9ACTN|nr:DUF4913 domain-containing protein [Streptomyces triticirhizae]RMI46739.1 DUF4913 domain-containing protein [Streptomyces triticirhizae]
MTDSPEPTTPNQLTLREAAPPPQEPAAPEQVDEPEQVEEHLPEPIRLDPADLATHLARLSNVFNNPAEDNELDPLEDLDDELPQPARPGGAGFILLKHGRARERELARLVRWVDDILLPNYGREISTPVPWCPWWPQHPEAVARLHALWAAWRQHIARDAGPSGPAIWHRDFLDHTMAQLRSAMGPFAACMTHPHRPAHRLLPPPPNTNTDDPGVPNAEA